MNKLLLLVFSILFISPVFCQDNAKAEWQFLFQKLSLSEGEIVAIAPNFPGISELSSSKEVVSAVRNWRQNFKSEWELLDATFDISNNHSLVYLGLYTSKELEERLSNQFHNGWVEWIKASDLTDKRLNEIAPHFPEYKESFTQADEASYNHEINKWRILYGHEYEALINAPELVALNPYYEGYADVVSIPKFIRALQSDEFPEKTNTDNPEFDEILFELNKQTWYFVYDPAGFKREYGFEPILPENFDVEKYRATVIDRIEMNKKIENGEVTATSDF